MKEKILKKEFIIPLICFISYFYFNNLVSLILDPIFNIFINNNISIQIYSIIKYTFFPIILFILFKDELINNIKIIKKKISSYLPNIITPYIFGFITMLVSNFILIFILKLGVATNEQQLNELYNTYPIYVVFASCIFGPFIEEMIFRFCLRKLIKNDKIFIIASGLIFGALHVIFDMSSIYYLLFIIPYGALGIAFAYTYVKTDNIWSTIGMHTLHNSALTILKMLV